MLPCFMFSKPREDTIVLFWLLLLVHFCAAVHLNIISVDTSVPSVCFMLHTEQLTVRLYTKRMQNKLFDSCDSVVQKPYGNADILKFFVCLNL